MLHDYDIVIVGSGAIGAVLASALRGSTLKVAVIEAVSPKADVQKSYDGRGLSISLSSKNILDNLGLWQDISPYSNPIKHIHVSDQHHFGFVRMDAESMNVSALGHIVLAGELGKVLIQTIEAAHNINFLCPASVIAVETSIASARVTVNIDGLDKVISCKLLVAADGAESKIRDMLDIKTSIKDYQQVAIVSNVTPQRPHLNTAYERFTETGPLALLPYSKQCCALVFTVMANEAKQYMQMDEQGFLSALLRRFGRRLGNFSKLGKRKSYPLKMLQVAEQVKHRAVILGNAAHVVHPNAAQGFNLGLRDAVALAEVLIEAHENHHDIGTLSLLESYLESREDDQKWVLNFTDRLAKVFYNRQALKVIARNLVLLGIDLVPPMKHRFAQNAMGFWGRQPSLISISPTDSKSSV